MAKREPSGEWGWTVAFLEAGRRQDTLIRGGVNEAEAIRTMFLQQHHGARILEMRHPEGGRMTFDDNGRVVGGATQS